MPPWKCDCAECNGRYETKTRRPCGCRLDTIVFGHTECGLATRASYGG